MHYIYDIARIYSVQNIAKIIIYNVDFSAANVHYRIQCNKIDGCMMNTVLRFFGKYPVMDVSITAEVP